MCLHALLRQPACEAARMVRAGLPSAIALFLSAFCLDCGATQNVTAPSGVTTGSSTAGSIAGPVESPLPRASLAPAVAVAAGDIGLCTAAGNPEATARLIDSLGGTVLALGDNAYPSGRAEDYRDCYDPTWGRHKAQTRPVPGNHEYETPGAVPYFDYFGASAGPRALGYYSFEIGGWHAVALNSNIAVGGGSPQGEWLQADLAASRTRCTIAYWHFPLFSSGGHGNQQQMRDVWRILYEAGADVVLGAHDHIYERFAPQDPDGLLDLRRGIREFVVGTGGGGLHQIARVQPNSEVRDNSSLGVLKLVLRDDGYDWSFVPVSGGPADAGSGVCH